VPRTLARPDVPTIDPLEEPVRRFLLTGDEEALDLVVRETRLRLLAAARRIGAPQDAEDSVQAAYLSLVRKRGEALGAPVFPWLLTAVIRTAYRRKALARREEAVARRLARPLDGPSPFTLAAGEEVRERVARAVERLPPAYRDPVVLHYLAGLPTKETAGLLDLPEATVRTRLRRARLLLRSRVPAGLLHGLFLVPWFLKDASESFGTAAGVAASGGLAMQTGGVVIVALGAAALGAFVGSKVMVGGAPPAPPPAAGPDASVFESRSRAERESLQKAHEAALAALRKEKADAEEKAAAADLRAAKAEEAAKAAAPAAGTPAVPAPPVAAKAPYSFPEYDEALAKVDWKSVGESTKQMVPLMFNLYETTRKGERPDIKNLGRIQQLNGTLIKAAAEVDEKLPGDGINGAYTHPAFQVNSIAATLEAAGLPLSAAQSESLGKIGREFTDRENARLQGYDAKAFELQKVLDEAGLKDSFFEQVFALLGADQKEALSPAASRGLVGLDLYSSGLMLQMRLAPISVKDLPAYEAQVERLVATRGKIPDERREQLRAAVKEWAASLPAEWFAGEPSPLVPVSLVEDAGRRQLVLLKKVVEELAPPDAGAAALRAGGHVLLPRIAREE
jgi:RNA polymerase sigma factor (sigma-70 family)